MRHSCAQTRQLTIRAGRKEAEISVPSVSSPAWSHNKVSELALKSGGRAAASSSSSSRGGGKKRQIYSCEDSEWDTKLSPLVLLCLYKQPVMAKRHFLYSWTEKCWEKDGGLCRTTDCTQTPDRRDLTEQIAVVWRGSAHCALIGQPAQREASQNT